MKPAGRILGTAFFLEGYEVQDAPRYGAGRRGAPIFAYVRAARATINERGIITRPDLIIVADDSLIAMPGAGVLDGCGEQTVLLLHSPEKANVWQERLNLGSPIFTLPQLTGAEPRYLGAACAGGAARLLGMIGQEALIEAVNREIAPLGQERCCSRSGCGSEELRCPGRAGWSRSRGKSGSGHRVQVPGLDQSSV